jgi:hypothetical protein
MYSSGIRGNFPSRAIHVIIQKILGSRRITVEVIHEATSRFCGLIMTDNSFGADPMSSLRDTNERQKAYANGNATRVPTTARPFLRKRSTTNAQIIAQKITAGFVRSPKSRD